MRIDKILFRIALGIMVSAGSLKAQQPKQLVLPSEAQQQWADAEIGAMFCFDVLNYKPDYNWQQWGTHPPASILNPSKLNTDQWIASAKAAGVKYAVLVAKHCSGFSLWPTKSHDYSMKSSPWKNGQGDLVRDFIASCEKYGVRPGIYYSAAANGYFHVKNPGLVDPGGPVDQKTYNKIILDQLGELWGNYGKLFEIWFDGGVQPVKDGGPDVEALLKKLQPDAVVFQGPSTAKNLLRWIGNEDGSAPYPNWSTTNTVVDANGIVKNEDLGGHPDGKTWCPAETDFPLRTGWQGGWFWKADDQQLLSKDQLVKNYLTSVGRNSNMMIGIVVDTSGLVPQEDMTRLKEFGDAVKDRFLSPVASKTGEGDLLELAVGKAPRQINGIVLREDISRGERIRKYIVEGMVNGSWKTIGQGSSVGNRRIELIDPVRVSKVRLKVTESVATPVLKQFAVLDSKI